METMALVRWGLKRVIPRWMESYRNGNILFVMPFRSVEEKSKLVT